MADIFTTGIVNNNIGTIAFKDDKTYHLNTADGDEDGTWPVNNDGNTITLIYDGTEEDNLTISNLSASILNLRILTESEDIDLDDNGIDEITLDFDTKLNLTK